MELWKNMQVVTIFKVKHISISFAEGLLCPQVWSRTQKIVRKIAVDDRKSMNFTYSEKQPCHFLNHTRLQNVKYLPNQSLDLNEILDLSSQDTITIRACTLKKSIVLTYWRPSPSSDVTLGTNKYFKLLTHSNQTSNSTKVEKGVLSTIHSTLVYSFIL